MIGKRRLLLVCASGLVVWSLSACATSLQSLQKFELSDFFRPQAPVEAPPPPALAPADNEAVTEAEAETAQEPSVHFVTPEDGAEVSSPVTVEMGATGLTVEPAGEVREGAGHMHILVDQDFVEPGEVILATEQMIHFGKGQLAATLELAPGEHTLRLQFADGAHIALEGEQYRDEITVTVTDGAAQAQEPSVFFVSPVDRAEVSSPLTVEMGASGLEVEPAGEVHEGAGHMHILVDQDFVPAGEVILATEQMIHFGQGQLAATLELAPGEHTLRLQFADGAHIALEGEQYRDEITVTVTDGAAHGHGPSVYFISPLNGEVVSSPVTVEMGASGLEVEPAGEVREGAGHMHILVDEEFVEPGELILATEQMIHFGQGQMSAELELTPGEHTLRLQFADGAHIALEGEGYRAEIVVNVK